VLVPGPQLNRDSNQVLYPKGNPVQLGSGPAAVNGDEIHESHCLGETGWEGMESRTIRKPEDLPDCGLQRHEDMPLDPSLRMK